MTANNPKGKNLTSAPNNFLNNRSPNKIVNNDIIVEEAKMEVNKMFRYFFLSFCSKKNTR
jgi:hypothetical protein